MSYGNKVDWNVPVPNSFAGYPPMSSGSPAMPEQRMTMEPEQDYFPDTPDNEKPAPKPAPIAQQKQKTGFAGILYSFNTTNQKLWLAAMFLQAIVVLVMIALIYVEANEGANHNETNLDSTFSDNPGLQTVATYLGLFILAELFTIYVSLDALLQKNTLQILMILAFQVCLLVYSGILPGQLDKAIRASDLNDHDVLSRVRAFSIVIPSMIGATGLVMAILAFRLYSDFGWDVYKRIGADIQLKKMYFRYQVFICLLKFDAFFILGFSIQFLVLVSGTPILEKILTIVALPVILLCIVLAGVSVRFENSLGVFVFFVLDVTGMTYFVYKLVRIFNSGTSRYDQAQTTLALFSVISFLMLLITAIVAGICLGNFNRGLKESIPSYSWSHGVTMSGHRRRASGDVFGANNRHGSDNQQRMSIE